VTEAFFHVQHMIEPPTLFFRPDILWKVLTTRTAATKQAKLTKTNEQQLSSLSPKAEA
jgi:hypothetical protein